MVPEDMNVGDWMVFGGMGAYTYGPKSEFNGMSSLSRIFTLKDVGVESSGVEITTMLGKNGLVPKLSNSA